MLARLDVLLPVARRFFFDHTSQGQWLHGWSSLILKELHQRSEHSWRSHESQKVFLKNVHDMTSFSLQAEVQRVPVIALGDTKLQRSDFGDAFVLADAWTANLFLSNFLPKISNSYLKEGRLGCSGVSSTFTCFQAHSVGEHQRFPIRGSLLQWDQS